MGNIYGYPSQGGSGNGGNTYYAGAGLTATTNPDGTITLSASGPFLTWYYDPSITNSRGLVAGNNVTISNAVDGACTISAQVTGSGATSSGSYLTMITEASLPQSRVATQGNGITITDGGAGGAGTIGVASTITGANILTWAPGDTILTGRRALILGSGLSSTYGSNTLTLSVTGQNAGTVTSVDVAAPFQTSSGAVTTAGTITLSYQNQLAGTLLIAPSGSTGSPTFRRILGQDLPIFGGSNVTVTTNATGGLVISSAAGGGSGTVTDLTVGNLSPVFTSNVATSTTTPAVTYTLSNAASATGLFGPKTGANAPPNYRAIVGSDLFNLVAGSNITISAVGDTLVFASTASGGGGGSVTSFSAGNLSPLFTTSVATATTTPALSFTIAQAASGQFVAGPVSGSNANLALRALATSDLPSGIPATKIGAGTVDDLEFGYLDGVTSAIQTQFSNKQPLDATLTALAAYNTTGFITQTAPDTFTGRTLATAGGLTIQEVGTVITISGSATQPLDSTLTALAAYNTNGILTQTAADTFTGRTITGTANEVTVSNGNGVSGNPTLSLASGIDATKIADGSVTSTEFQYINTLTSNAQTQIDGKAANTEAFVTLGNTSGLTNERRLEVAGGLTIQDLGAGNAVTISGSAINGTVTSFSAGDLSPLFTTTESTVTTTPALSFAAVNQASGGLAYLSPASGSAAAPSFRAIGGSDVANTFIAGANITLTQVASSNKLQITAATGGGGSTFTSTDQTITAAGTATIAHGLGHEPIFITCYLVCQSANNGYSVNDVLLVQPAPLSMTVDATNLYIRYPSAGQWAIFDKSTGNPTGGITYSDWKLRVKAN